MFLVVLSLSLTTAGLGDNTPTVRWGHQILTPTDDGLTSGQMVVNSNGSIFLIINRDRQSKSSTRYLLKYTQAGTQVWSKPLGANGVHMWVHGLAAGDRGSIYLFGNTNSSLGRENMGKLDAFFAKYDQTGTQVWVRQVGTPQDDGCNGLDIDADGNLYIAGHTHGDFAKSNKGGQDMFIAAYTQTGALLWKDQIGAGANVGAAGIGLDDNKNVYVCGGTSGSLARANNGLDDIVVARYTHTGKRLWLRQYGTPAHDRAGSIDVSEQGHVYVGGNTGGDFAYKRAQRGGGDAFVARIAETGEMLWQRQFGSRYWDKVWDMACFRDGSGDILAVGCQIPNKICQGFCRRYSPEGKLVWKKEFTKRKGRKGPCGRMVAVDSANNCYHAGVTQSDLFEVNNGTGNVYIVRLDGAEDEQAGP
jgi:hypothetical protein